MENNSKKQIHKADVLLAVILLIYGCFLVFLFYNQTTHMGPDDTGYYSYESDLPYHIEMAENSQGYSLTSIIYMFCNLFPHRNALIALFLTACSVGTTVVIYRYMLKNGMNRWYAAFFSLVASFIMPFFVKPIQSTMYIGYQSASIWHNSTYIVMKFIATLCIITYLDIASEYRQKVDIKKLILFTILLTMTTSVKSSFIMVFAPAALIMLIVDGILGVFVKNLLLCALSVVPAGIAMVVQSMLLFDGTAENGIAVDFGYTAKYFAPKHPYLTMFLSLVTVIVIVVYNLVYICKNLRSTFADKEAKGDRVRDRFLWTAFLTFIVGMAEFLLFYETGKRQFDGNFSWGYFYGIFLMTVSALMLLYKNITQKQDGKGKALRIIYMVGAFTVIAYQTLCGIYFFLNLVIGKSYWM